MKTEYNWEKVTMQAAFAPRNGAGALTYQGRMWLLGGWNPGDKVNFPRICNNDVWMVAGNNMQPDVWKLVPTRVRAPCVQP